MDDLIETAERVLLAMYTRHYERLSEKNEDELNEIMRLVGVDSLAAEDMHRFKMHALMTAYMAADSARQRVADIVKMKEYAKSLGLKV